MTTTPEPIRASLFVTCIVDQFYPEVGESTARVLSRLGVDLDFPKGQTCCGQPAFNSGFWREAKPLARRLLAQFKASDYIVVPSGSCASMIKVFYPELLHDEPNALADAQALAQRVFELSEFIVNVLGITDLGPYVRSDADAPARKLTYHEGCHLRRELGVVDQPRALLRSLPGVEMAELSQPDVCCGFGGTFSVKYPDISAAMLQDKLDDVRSTGAEGVVACDSSCLMQIGGGIEKQGMAVRPMHLAQVLEEALT